MNHQAVFSIDSEIPYHNMKCPFMRKIYDHTGNLKNTICIYNITKEKMKCKKCNVFYEKWKKLKE